MDKVFEGNVTFLGRVFATKSSLEGNHDSFLQGVFLSKSKESILDVDQSERYPYEIYVTVDTGEIYQFVNGVDNEDLRQVLLPKVYNETLEGGSAIDVNLGDITKIKYAVIEYIAENSGDIQSGRIRLTNKNDSDIHRQSEFDNIPISFEKTIVNDEIILIVNNDTLPNSDISLTLTINKILI